MGYGKCEAHIRVEVNFKGELAERHVGYIKRMQPKLVDEEWVDSDIPETLFGICDQFGYLTHMCYSRRTFGIKSWEGFAVTSKHPRKFDEFYFDAGSNGRPLYVTYRELRQAMYALGLVGEDAIKYCANCEHPKLQHSERGECSKILNEDNTSEESCPCSCYSYADPDFE